MRSVCVGDNVIDYYVNSKRMYPGGNSVNVSVHLARLKAESSYLGNLADDMMAEVIVRALDVNHVDHSRCKQIENATTKHCNYEIIDGERRFISVDTGDRWSGSMELTEELLDYIGGFDVVISNCNAKMQDEMSKISRLDVLYVYDFGEKEKYHAEEYLDKVCTNLDLAMFSFPETSEDELKSFANKIIDKGCRNVLITMGRNGQYLINSELAIHGDAQYVEAVDTMGAGDSFLAAFIKEACDSGWKKNMILDKKTIEKALNKASRYSCENCLSEGGFGYEISETALL